jgi:hypothetical protein
MYQRFDLGQRLPEVAISLYQLFIQPISRPPDEVGGKKCQLLLNLHPNGGANQVTFQGKDPFDFFDTRFNRLAAIIGVTIILSASHQISCRSWRGIEVSCSSYNQIARSTMVSSRTCGLCRAAAKLSHCSSV